MALNPPQSGWTAMSLAPNPDLFAAATNNINRVSSGIVAPAPSIAPLSIAPAPAYAQLSQNIFPQLQQQQLQQQQLAAQAQATAAPANAFAAVEKQLKTDPWNKPGTTPQSNFLNPTVTKPTAPASGWVPSNSLPTI